MATYAIEFGALGDTRPVPPLTVRTTDPNVLARTVEAHAQPYITPVLEELGRPELADCLFRTTSDQTGGEFLHLDLAAGKGIAFLGARIHVTPERIQRKRTKGWTSNGAKYVGRGTRWGNPSQIVRTTTGWAVNHDNGSGVGTFPNDREARRFAVDAYRAHLKANRKLAERARKELAGRDLMCWCPLDDPCHADVLLELVNGGAS